MKTSFASRTRTPAAKGLLCSDGGNSVRGPRDRLREELALEAQVRFLFKFRYHARYDAAGAEHEICHVYAGALTGRAAVNPNEVAATTLMAASALDRDLADRPEVYTPWLRLAWTRVREIWPTAHEIIGSLSTGSSAAPAGTGDV